VIWEESASRINARGRRGDHHADENASRIRNLETAVGVEEPLIESAHARVAPVVGNTRSGDDGGLRIVDAESSDLSALRLRVEALVPRRVALLERRGYIPGQTDSDSDLLFTLLRVDSYGLTTAQMNAAAPHDLGGDEADARIFVSRSASKTRALRQVRADNIAVKQRHGAPATF
jgi:hypothetical protein